MYSHSYSCSLLPVFWNQSRRNVQLVQVVRANALLEQLLFQFFHFRLIYRHVHFSGFYRPLFLDFVMLYCKIQGSTTYIYIYSIPTSTAKKYIYVRFRLPDSFPFWEAKNPDPTPIFFTIFGEKIKCFFSYFDPYFIVT